MWESLYLPKDEVVEAYPYAVSVKESAIFFVLTGVGRSGGLEWYQTPKIILISHQISI